MDGIVSTCRLIFGSYAPCDHEDTAASRRKWMRPSQSRILNRYPT